MYVRKDKVCRTLLANVCENFHDPLEKILGAPLNITIKKLQSATLNGLQWRTKKETPGHQGQGKDDTPPGSQ